MSDYEVDEQAEADAQFFGLVTDDPEVRLGSSVPQPGPADAVTRRFFHEDGSPRSEPTADAGEAIWNAYADGLEEQFEAEAARIDPATDYTSPAQSWAADEFDAAVQNEAAIAVNAEAFTGALVDLVRERWCDREFGVRDEDAIHAVAGEVEQWRKDLFRDWMARGATVQQGLGALRDLDVVGAVRAGLEQRRYWAITNTGELAAWRQKQMGQPPRRNVGHRSLERMAEKMQGHIDRVEAQQQWFRDRGYR